MTDAATVSAELELRRVAAPGAGSFVLVNLHYTSADPWAVRMSFRTPSSDHIEWVFARELLAEGAEAPIGDGDVRLWPVSTSRAVRLSLSSPSGSAVFELDGDQLAEFLASTFVLVPLGAEIELVDLDAELALLLTSER